MIRRFFLATPKNQLKSGYFWTTLSGLLYSGSTFLMLLFITHLTDAYQGGVYSIALAIGQQLVTIGYFNVKTYQASDIKETFTFSDYLVNRFVTTFLMMIIGIGWMFIGGYEGETLQVIIWMLIFKMGESVADVLQGLFQQKNRYDISGKCVFFETAIFLTGFAGSLLISRSLTTAMCVMAVLYLIALLAIDCRLVSAFSEIKVKFDFTRQRQLFMECLPLFINSFLQMYINNSAKYAIDASETKEVLAYFNVLFMPAFVINLFAGILLKPLVTSLALRYHEREKSVFVNTLKSHTVMIGGLTVLCLIAAYAAGIPVLSFLYGLDLSQYRLALCIMILGGAFCAVYTMFQYAIIIMRHQYYSLIGCGITALTASLLMPYLVERYSIMGAAWGYLALMIMMSFIYMAMAVYFMNKSWNKEEKLE